MNNIFKQVFNFLRTTVRKFRKYFNEYAAKAIHVLEVVKIVIDNPSLDLLTELTATKVDDEILKALRRALTLFFAGSIYPLNPTPEQINKYIEELRGMTKEQRNASIFKIGSLIIRTLADQAKESISATEADTLLQLSYKAVKQGSKV